MQFHTEIDYQNETLADDLHGMRDLLMAKQDVFQTLVQVIRIGFDGLGRTASARILDENLNILATLSLTVDVQEA